MNMMEYKGYHAKIEYSSEDGLFVGNVFGIEDSLFFEGSSVQELEVALHETIDDYLIICEEIGKAPEKEFKGSLNIRISKEDHRNASLEAYKRGVSLNQFIAEAIQNELRSPQTRTVLLPMQEVNGYPVSTFNDDYSVQRYSIGKGAFKYAT